MQHFPLGIDVVFAAPGISRPAALDADRTGGERLMYVAVKGGEQAIDAAHRLLPRSGAAITPCRR